MWRCNGTRWPRLHFPTGHIQRLASKNLVADAGRAAVGPERVPLNPTGEFESEKQFRDLLIRQPWARPANPSSTWGMWPNIVRGTRTHRGASCVTAENQLSA